MAWVKYMCSRVLWAICGECSNSTTGTASRATPVSAACTQAIARIVSSHMGGAYDADSEAQMQQRWAASSAEVRRRRGRPIVPAAQLRVGLGVHRALLFKFLADTSNVPCRLVGSGACEGAHFLAADQLSAAKR